MQNDLSTIDKLKETRVNTTREAAFIELESLLSSVANVNGPGSIIGNSTNNYYYDNGTCPDLSTLSSFDLLGIRRQVYSQLETTKNCFKIKYEDEEEIEFERYMDDFRYRKAKTPQMLEDLSHLRETIPIQQAMIEIATAASNKQMTGMSKMVFGIAPYPLQFLEVLGKLGVRLTDDDDRIRLSKMEDQEDIMRYLTEVIIPRAERDNVLFKTMEENVDGQLVDTIILKTQITNNIIDFKLFPQREGYKFGYSVAANMTYFEQPNQDKLKKTLPFIESKTAQDLLNSLDNAGISFSPSFMLEMSSARENDGFGCVLTQISREIAKFVNDINRLNFNPLFRKDDEILDKIQKINTTNIQDKTAKALILMLQDIVLRKDNLDNVDSDLEVTKSEVLMKDGSCFDVVGYYEEGRRMGRLKLETYGDVQLIHKFNYGSDTYMTTGPIIFNGIHLPPGALMKKGDDGKFALVRLTPYIDIDDALYGGFAPEVSKAFDRCNLRTLTPLNELA